MCGSLADNFTITNWSSHAHRSRLRVHRPPYIHLLSLSDQLSHNLSYAAFLRKNWTNFAEAFVLESLSPGAAAKRVGVASATKQIGISRKVGVRKTQRGRPGGGAREAAAGPFQLKQSLLKFTTRSKSTKVLKHDSGDDVSHPRAARFEL
jgi:hypothetical protein